MTWWRRRKQEIRQAEEAVRRAEQLRDGAEEEQRKVECLAPRVDAAASALQRLRTENHFGPMIESILRGGHE